MKLKRLPEDFQVEELTDFAPGEGRFALYRLTKRGLGTPEVIDALSRDFAIARERISYGGLKDRHALTRQYVTIRDGPRSELRQESFDLAYLGQAGRPFTPRDIRGNRFVIAMRDMRKDEVARAEDGLAEVARDGLPNGFDEQRFGSLGESGEFVARALCEGNYERALWLALADPNEHDRPHDREQKRILRERWGDWRACKERLARSHARSIVSFLADRPGDFKGAIARVHKEQRSLWLAAFQGFLWNRLLAGFLREVCAPSQLAAASIKGGPILFPRALDDRQRERLSQAVLPLPSARARLEGPMKARVERVLAEAGLELRQLRIRHPKDSYFAKGERAAMVRPEGLRHEAADDDLYAGRRKLTLRFDLPRGSYATILVKRLTEV